MKFKELDLWPSGCSNATISCPECDSQSDARPAVLVIPGGGYSQCCYDWEGTPIATRFAELGFRTFILRYRVAPCTNLEPVQDAMRAMRILRGNASAWGVIPNNIAVCGFSAGGHLAATLGTIARYVNADAGDSFDAVAFRPDAQILSYATLSGGEFAHRGSVVSLMGKYDKDTAKAFSLELHVDADTPPAYIWATQEDQLVPAENSIVFANAMRRVGIPCELHIFPHGGHGVRLGEGRRDIPNWPLEATRFLQESCAFAETTS